MEDTAGRGIEYHKDVTIGGHTYRLVAFSPTRSIKLLTKLTKLIGEPFAVMAGANTGGDKMKAVQMLPIAIKALTARLDENEVESLITELMACVSKGKHQVDFNLEFRMRLGDLMKMIKEIIEFQFEDFFSALSEMFQGEEEMETKEAG